MADIDYEPPTWDLAADHVARYLATDGEDGFIHAGVEIVLIGTTGRRTGRPRFSPVIRVTDGDRYVAIASMGGSPTHPGWFHNLTADPNIEVRDRATVHQMRARVATGEEKARLWKLATERWPAYDDYQARTERKIPLVVCEPR